MSAICEICKREFRTTQGLRGHKTFVHQMTTTQDPPARLATGQELSELSEVIKQVVALLKPIVDLHVKQLRIIENLTQYSHSIGEQVNKLAMQVSNDQTENRELAQGISKSCNDLGQLKINLKRLSRFVQYEFAGVHDDMIWELYLDSPELKSKLKIKRPK